MAKKKGASRTTNSQRIMRVVFLVISIMIVLAMVLSSFM
jgi:hypothetical protein